MRHEWRDANPPSRFVVSEYSLRLLALLLPLLPVLPLPHASNVLTRSDNERSAESSTRLAPYAIGFEAP
jgi:hypothetical protein